MKKSDAKPGMRVTVARPAPIHSPEHSRWPAKGVPGIVVEDDNSYPDLITVDVFPDDKGEIAMSNGCEFVDVDEVDPIRFRIPADALEVAFEDAAINDLVLEFLKDYNSDRGVDLNIEDQLCCNALHALLHKAVALGSR